MVYRLLARQLPGVEKVLPDLIKGWVEKVQADAASRAAGVVQ